MIADAATLDRSAFERTFDVCVIGAGPAGITLARTLAAAGRSGGADGSRRPRDHRGEPGLLRRQQRRAATTSTSTSAGCATSAAPRTTGAAGAGRSTPIDFMPKPLGALFAAGRSPSSTSTPTAPRPTHILDLARRRAEAPDLPMRQHGYDFQPLPVPLQPADPLRREVPAEIAASPRSPSCSTPTSSTSASTTRSRTVTGAVFRSYDPADERLHRRRPAPMRSAAGGIENARLLLNFASQMPEGIGNRYGWSAAASPTTRTSSSAKCVLRRSSASGSSTRRPSSFMLERACLNFGMRLEPRWIGPPNCPRSPARSSAEEFNILLEKLVRDPIDRPHADRPAGAAAALPARPR